MYIRSMYMRCHEYGDSGESMLIDEYAKERVGESHRISTPLTRTCKSLAIDASVTRTQVRQVADCFSRAQLGGHRITPILVGQQKDQVVGTM